MLTPPLPFPSESGALFVNANVAIIDIPIIQEIIMTTIIETFLIKHVTVGRFQGLPIFVGVKVGLYDHRVETAKQAQPPKDGQASLDGGELGGGSRGHGASSLERKRGPNVCSAVYLSFSSS
mmetsp:Transcript_18833/g.51596  ORF Transcript_18833/g.51596 Transcript_18833/m.51596 type:complete len:122 (-) Transcript_18833:56-421(-)